MSQRILVTLAGVLLVAGCSGGDEADAKAATPAAAAPRTVVDDMVTAVSPGRSTNNIDVKFAIAKRPAKGQPIEIDLVIVPKVANNTLRLLIQNTDGIAIQSGAEFERLKGAEPNVPLNHRVVVVPERDGIFAISAVALLDTEEMSLTRMFAIPIIVGEGVAPAQFAADSPH